MIEFIKSWCEGIIVAVVISIIIEMLLPEGNNKKYIKVIIGIYILFVIIGPILGKINIEYNFKNFIKYDEITVSNNFDNNIKDVYIDGIEENIKLELENVGYFVENVIVKVDNKYENIEKIEITLLSNNNDKKENGIKINEIKINKKPNIQIENSKINELLEKNYNVPKEKIYIFQN